MALGPDVHRRALGHASALDGDVANHVINVSSRAPLPRDHDAVREDVNEVRIDHGPGYRIYFMRRGAVLVVLLAGGDKSTQDADIKTAIKIAREWKD